MKLYVKPTLIYMILTAEEQFAVTSACTKDGQCPNGFRYN